MARPQVVIVGAGFGGLTCARALRHVPVDVTLLDRNNYHLFTPLLYQVASAVLDPGEIARPVRSLIRPLPNVEFRMADVQRVDLGSMRVVTDRGEIPYDYLVLAAGSATNYFGNPALQERANALKDLPDGLALRNRVLELFEASRWEPDPAVRRRMLTFVVVGGGPTGVEYAGALSELIHLVLTRDYPGFDPAEASVLLLEGAATLLATFDPRLRDAADTELRRKGIQVRYNAQVTEMGDGWVTLLDGTRLEAQTVIWTAGVQASALGRALGVEPARQGRISVDDLLSLPGHPEVFVIGDLAAVEQGGTVLPMLIPVAMQEARHVGHVIDALVAGRIPAPFSYRDPGIMATIGRNAAVAQLSWIKLSGFPGWVFWLLVHLVNVVSFRSRILVLVNWAWEYLLLDRPVRLIVTARGPAASRRRPDGSGTDGLDRDPEAATRPSGAEPPEPSRPPEEARPRRRRR